MEYISTIECTVRRIQSLDVKQLLMSTFFLAGRLDSLTFYSTFLLAVVRLHCSVICV